MYLCIYLCDDQAINPSLIPSLIVNYVCRCAFECTLVVCCFHSEIGTAMQHSYADPIFHYERLGCRGNENSLLECQSRKFVNGDCNHGKVAGVVCAETEGKVSLEIVLCNKQHIYVVWHIIAQLEVCTSCKRLCPIFL